MEQAQRKLNIIDNVHWQSFTGKLEVRTSTTSCFVTFKNACKTHIFLLNEKANKQKIAVINLHVFDMLCLKWASQGIWTKPVVIIWVDLHHPRPHNINLLMFMDHALVHYTDYISLWPASVYIIQSKYGQQIIICTRIYRKKASMSFYKEIVVRLRDLQNLGEVHLGLMEHFF